MKEYWNNPEATAQDLRDGWLYTGDIAQADDDGYLSIVDRKKDMIIAGGFNVYPKEVGEDMVDEMVAWVMKTYCDQVVKHKNTRGGNLVP